MAKKKQIDINGLRDIEAYTHDDKKRTNNPPVGMAQYDAEAEQKKTYKFDPHLDPTLVWAGKEENNKFDVLTSSIHIHESIKPHKILWPVENINDGSGYERQGYLFEDEDPVKRMRKRNETIEFYQHGRDWTNRLIAGDSLIIMNSMLEKEGMAGAVQMVYIDPPYGIKYGSNFQPFIDKRDVKDKKDDDLTAEPEMITAFRDTWELGIHSYLTYLRDRLLLAKELLADTGCVFVQIGDKNLHYIRTLCDEIFGVDNFFTQISFRKTTPLKCSGLAGICDYLVCYAKDVSRMKYHDLFENKEVGEGSGYTWLELPDGSRRKMTTEEKKDITKIPSGSRPFSLADLASTGYTDSCMYDFEFGGKHFKCGKKSWRTNYAGMQELIRKKRVFTTGARPSFVQYYDDFPYQSLSNLWNDTSGATDMKYVVQTSTKVIQRCMLMTTDPGDLVLDITCGSGTTAYVAEQWGRRWITCDTSRVSIAIAKQRLLTATFDYYKLAHPEQGIAGGFTYKNIPHISLKMLANNEEPESEILYNQPEIDKNKVRVSGPFTVEALPAPIVKPLEYTDGVYNDVGAKQSDWRDELLANGIWGKNGTRIKFVRVEPMPGTKYLQADAETENGERAVICFAGETRPMDSRMVKLALDEAEELRPSPKMVVFAAFQFDPEASKDIDDAKWPGVNVLKVQMNTDLMTEDLRKKRSSSQSFMLIGQPDVEIKPTKKKDEYIVSVKGFDYYDVANGNVVSGNANKIAMWMLDVDYDGMCIEPEQVFFPMAGKTDGWAKLAKTLKAEINQDLIEKYSGTESLPFKIKSPQKIAVKIIDDRGIEMMKIIKL